METEPKDIATMPDGIDAEGVSNTGGSWCIIWMGQGLDHVSAYQ